jgi:hypothetical protein
MVMVRRKEYQGSEESDPVENKQEQILTIRRRCPQIP